MNQDSEESTFQERLFDFQNDATFQKRQDFNNFLRKDVVDKMKKEREDNCLRIGTIRAWGTNNTTTNLWKPNKLRELRSKKRKEREE